ncbi:MAG: hypothetical protein ACREUG_09550 [Steroidobacteraceae bacterium]
MATVVQLPKLVAWAPEAAELAPGRKHSAVSLSAILVAPDLMLRRDGYLSLLGARIQRIVNLCEDAQESTDTLVEDLFEAGLYPDVGHVPAGLAGAYLVSSNPGTRQRLDSWGVLPMPPAWSFGPTREMREAREETSADHDCPEDRLRSWAGLLSGLP